MYNPVNTYRLQFNRNFSLEDFSELLDYFQALGIKTIYASPVFSAAPGSDHGYDVINPCTINPEIGRLEDLQKLVTQLRDKGIGWLQDIVPNHMAFHFDNAWLRSVLEHGPCSAYYNYFDIWCGKNEKILAPFLAKPLPETIDTGELKVSYTEKRLVFSYFENRFPLNAESYAVILQDAESREPGVVELRHELEKTFLRETSGVDESCWNHFLEELQRFVEKDHGASWLNACIEKANRELLPYLSDSQYYRLAHWREANTRINYRRFFAVNELISLHMEDQLVFDAYHPLIRRLVKETGISGIRVDHIDGLYDPSRYLERLRKAVGDSVYISVEKILEADEPLTSWPVQGTTGYDFLAQVNNLLSNRRNEKKLTDYYQEQTGEYGSQEKALPGRKKAFLRQYLSADLDQLVNRFLLAAGKKLARTDKTEIKKALAAFVACCPVYRFYGNKLPLTGTEAGSIADILNRIQVAEQIDPALIQTFRDLLLDPAIQDSKEERNAALKFYCCCMQLTVPAMAKSMEDTLMYQYNRFIAHNEVGDSPFFFGLSRSAFHQAMIARQQQWPLTQNTTATHDTKRGEDARARINVLSDIPDLWISAVNEWRQANARFKVNGSPDFNDEFFIYQTLVGSFPLAEEDRLDFTERLIAYIQKALREEKIHSDWQDPNLEYEEACKQFARQLLDPKNDFLPRLLQLLDRVADYGIMNSLVQLVLKCTCSGLPDFYQGSETWDLSLVDPDNRRPIDYASRKRILSRAKENRDLAALRKRWKNRKNGEIKCWLMHELLLLRNSDPDLFLSGDYIPLEVRGALAHYVIAFARRQSDRWVIVALPLHLAELGDLQQKSILSIDWQDTAVLLPEELNGNTQELLLRAPLSSGKKLAVKFLFRELPLAILTVNAVKKNKTPDRGSEIELSVLALK